MSSPSKAAPHTSVPTSTPHISQTRSIEVTVVNYPTDTQSGRAESTGLFTSEMDASYKIKYRGMGVLSSAHARHSGLFAHRGRPRKVGGEAPAPAVASPCHHGARSPRSRRSA